jgi:DNA-binding GntR family transcriptional regulator
MLQRQDPTFRVAPLERAANLRRLTYDAIKRSILTAEPGADADEIRIDERGIASSLGVSRTPVREALMLLEQEGFVLTKPRRGTFVARRTAREIVEIMTAWAALESLAAHAAARTAADADLAALGGLVEGPSPDDPADLAFHRAIVRLGGCGLMEEMIDTLFLHMRAGRAFALNRGGRALHERAAIVAALRSRDAERAAVLVRDHVLELAADVERRRT